MTPSAFSASSPSGGLGTRGWPSRLVRDRLVQIQQHICHSRPRGDLAVVEAGGLCEIADFDERGGGGFVRRVGGELSLEGFGEDGGLAFARGAGERGAPGVAEAGGIVGAAVGEDALGEGAGGFDEDGGRSSGPGFAAGCWCGRAGRCKIRARAHRGWCFSDDRANRMEGAGMCNRRPCRSDLAADVAGWERPAKAHGSADLLFPLPLSEAGHGPATR